MLSVLRRIETLKVDLERIDPARDADAADRIADLAVVLRNQLAAVGALDVAATGASRSAG